MTLGQRKVSIITLFLVIGIIVLSNINSSIIFPKTSTHQDRECYPILNYTNNTLTITTLSEFIVLENRGTGNKTQYYPDRNNGIVIQLTNETINTTLLEFFSEKEGYSVEKHTLIIPTELNYMNYLNISADSVIANLFTNYNVNGNISLLETGQVIAIENKTVFHGMYYNLLPETNYTIQLKAVDPFRRNITLLQECTTKGETKNV